MIAAFFVSPIASADYMTSTNYKVQSDSLNIGGARSTSTGYITEDTFGELATGEGLSSTNYKSCVGYQCLGGAPTLTFSIGAGYTTPGTSGGTVALGNLLPSAVKTSDGITVKSIFITASSPAGGGTVITVRDENNGLFSPSISKTIASASAPLAAGTPGYGICVLSSNNLTKSAPYNNSCTKTTGHTVCLVDGTNRTILSAGSFFADGAAEILVKAAISNVTPAAADYGDTLTFILTSTY